MKKYFLLIIIMTLCLGILVGCGKSEEAQSVDDKIKRLELLVWKVKFGLQI